MAIVFSHTASVHEADPTKKVTPVVISDLTVQDISYPDKVVVPVVISDLDLVRGAEFYRYYISSFYCALHGRIKGTKCAFSLWC